jgi:hypothetical protein
MAALFSSTAATGPVDIKWIVAGLTYREMGVEFEDAVELLGEIPQEQLREFQDTLLSDEGKSVVFSNEELSVLDNSEPGGVLLRSLIFNARPNLVQTAVLVDSEGNVDLSRPPPSEGGSSTHLQGLALSVALHRAQQQKQLGPREGRAPPRVCVLGAGGCSLPAHLFSAIPGATVDAVELSPGVLTAARDFFGVAALEASPRFALHCGCAVAYLAESQAVYDVMIIDIEGGNGGDDDEEADPLVAPPRTFLSAEFLSSAQRALAPGGVVAMNAIGTPAAVQSALDALAENWPLHTQAVCKAPNASDDRHHILLSCNDGDIATGAELQAALMSHARLVDNAAQWVEGYRQI